MRVITSAFHYDHHHHRDRNDENAHTDKLHLRCSLYKKHRNMQNIPRTIADMWSQ